MKKNHKNKKGQAITEYIIIVVLIALAGLAVFGLFGDRIRQMVGGAVEELGGDSATVSEAVGDDGDSVQYLRDLRPSGN